MNEKLERYKLLRTAARPPGWALFEDEDGNWTPYDAAQAQIQALEQRTEKAENERDEAVEAADRLLGEREAAVTTAERLVGDVKRLVKAALREG